MVVTIKPDNDYSQIHVNIVMFRHKIKELAIYTKFIGHIFEQ